MDANKDVTIRKSKRQKASCNSTNLSNSLNECTEGIKGLNEEAENNLVPVRLWIRGHYIKLTKNNETRCIHCNEKFIISMSKLAALHEHLVETHPDKLIEEQKKEIKFHWIWDHYTAKSDRQATCKQCKVTVTYYTISDLKKHLKRIHKISGPSDNVIDNESNSDDDMDANKDRQALRKAKCQEASSNSTNLSDSLQYECAEGTEAIKERTPYNLIPIRRWMRKHYTKLTRNRARCNHCNERFSIYNLHTLHKHLVEAHPDKLAEEEKKEVKFHWTWDYFIPKGNTKAICKECKKIIKYSDITQLKLHLKRIHMIFGPGSDNHMDNENNSSNYVDADRNTTIKNAKYQEDLSTGSCNNSCENTGGTEDLNEFVPSASNTMDYYGDLSDTDSAEYLESSDSDDLSFDEIFDLIRQE